jgi:competence protein ComEA
MFALALTLGLFLISCVKRPNHQAAVQTDSTVSFPNQPQRININIASARELEKLPGIGEGFAARIVDHREKFGPFRRPEHLIIVRGISDRRFRALRDLITVE